MLFGFGSTDITPRIGVQLTGYGPYLNRISIGVRDPLYARAIAVSDGQTTALLVACDLTCISKEIADAARTRTEALTGVPTSNICIHTVHTHSGPATYNSFGWGEVDPPYIEVLVNRIVSVCQEALKALAPHTLHHTEVPCVGLGYDREHLPRPEVADCMQEDWQPELTELTDTTAHIFRFDNQDGMQAFATYYSCHPVVGSQTSRYIHGDFVGVATNLMTRMFPDSQGFFLQGCHGNINSCFVHYDEADSLRQVDILAARYMRQVMPGIEKAAPLDSSDLRVIARTISLTRDPLPVEALHELLAGYDQTLQAADANDNSFEVRIASVYAQALRQELKRIEVGGVVPDPELFGLRIGDLTILAAPFEIMHRYKLRIEAAVPGPVLVMSNCNGCFGYAAETECFAGEDNYAARMVPYIIGVPPFAATLEDELVTALIDLANDLRK